MCCCTAHWRQVTNYRPSTVGLHSSQYDLIASIVAKDLQDENLDILGNQERIYDPAQYISEATQLEYEIYLLFISKLTRLLGLISFPRLSNVSQH